MAEHHLVEKDYPVVSSPFLQALPEQEALHLGYYHSLHCRVLLQQAGLQVTPLAGHLAGEVPHLVHHC